MSEDCVNGRKAMFAVEELRYALWTAFGEIRLHDGLEVNDGRFYAINRENFALGKNVTAWEGILEWLLAAAERSRGELDKLNKARDGCFPERLRDCYENMEGMRPSAREQHCADLVMGLAHCAVTALVLWYETSVRLTEKERCEILMEVSRKWSGGGSDGGQEK